jgi:hypothetical protein
MIPIAKLRIECIATNPVKPAGVCVIDNGDVIAVLEIDELKKAYARLIELEATYAKRLTSHDAH